MPAGLRGPRLVLPSSDSKAKQPSGSKHKLAKAASLPGKNGNPTFAAVAAGYDKSPGEWLGIRDRHHWALGLGTYLWPDCLLLTRSPLLQVGTALPKSLQAKQISRAALASHTLLLTAMAQTGMAGPPQSGWRQAASQAGFTSSSCVCALRPLDDKQMFGGSLCSPLGPLTGEEAGV